MVRISSFEFVRPLIKVELLSADIDTTAPPEDAINRYLLFIKRFLANFRVFLLYNTIFSHFFHSFSFLHFQCYYCLYFPYQIVCLDVNSHLYCIITLITLLLLSLIRVVNIYSTMHFVKYADSAVVEQ